MAVNKQFRAKFERTSFGTSQAKAARKSVSPRLAAKVVARSGRYVQRAAGTRTTRSGG
jgi:hypothetical protein